MLTINHVTKHFGGQTLFRDASITFSKGSNYGIVGANGSGKSTLLRILTGEEEPSAGELSVPRRARLGVLKQDHFQYEETRILDVVMMGHGPVWTAMQERDALLENAENEFDADKYSALEEIIMQHDGYALEARAAEILAGLNVPDEVHEQPLSVLSGGFKLRVLLAQTLAGNPDVLLLDEPTNHLDILSIRWLEKFLESFKGTSMVVSHDHRFLNNVCSHIVDVDYERVTVYKGNYNDFVEAKQTDRDRMEAEIGKREKEIADHKRFVEKFKAKPTKARQAQSRAKVIDKIVIEELPNSSRRYPTFQLEARRPSGKQVVEIEGISKAYGDKQVLSDVSLRVMRDDRLAIIGPNGIGKSTLLKILVGELQADGGSVEWGYETHPGYFAQDHSEVLARQKGSIQEWLWDQVAGETIGYIRGRLAQVLFQKDEVEKKVANLSGGERARLIFAQLGVLKPNVLILDEPTNHLDLEGIEALAQGIEAYDGTTIFVSHDRWFVNRLATRVLEITPDKLNDFQGTYDEYLAKLGDDHLDVDAVVRQARREKRKAKNA